MLLLENVMEDLLVPDTGPEILKFLGELQSCFDVGRVKIGV